MEGITISKLDYKYPINLKDYNMVKKKSRPQTNNMSELENER